MTDLDVRLLGPVEAPAGNRCCCHRRCVPCSPASRRARELLEDCEFRWAREPLAGFSSLLAERRIA